MTVISRLQLDHPALGAAGGSGLHSSIEAIYTKIGDNMNSRFFVQNALADTASQDFEHNFKTDFDEIKYILYLRDTGTGELTKIDGASTPPITDFAFAATTSFETTKITVTNNSGAARDIALIVVHGDPGSVDASISQSGQVNTSAQNFLGLKGFTSGAVIYGSAASPTSIGHTTQGLALQSADTVLANNDYVAPIRWELVDASLTTTNPKTVAWIATKVVDSYNVDAASGAQLDFATSPAAGGVSVTPTVRLSINNAGAIIQPTIDGVLHSAALSGVGLNLHTNEASVSSQVRNVAMQLWHDSATAANGVQCYFVKTNGTTATQLDEVIADFNFYGYDTASGAIAARIRVAADGEFGTAGDATDSPGRIEFATSPNGSSTLATRMAINSDGIVSFGSEITTGISAPNIHASGSGATNIQISRVGATANAPILFFAKGRGTVVTPTVSLSGDEIARISGYSHDGTNYVESASIKMVVDGAPGTNDMPGRIIFNTSPDGSATPTEALRIDSKQNTIITGATVSPTSITHETKGFVLRNGDTSLTANDYFPPIRWEATDSTLTTTNPKTVAWIAARAAETFSADTSSGAKIEFATSPSAGGASVAPTINMTLEANGGLTITSLSGTGTRMVTADTNGLLAASTIVTSGVYTPTFANTANNSGGTARQHNYTRVGNIVTVTGSVDTITNTSTATLTQLTLTSLPVATANFSTVYQASGSGTYSNNAGGNKDAAKITAVSGAQTVLITIESTTIGNATGSCLLHYAFSYQIQ